MNLGTARIVVIVALVVAGVALIANGFGDTGAVTTAAGSVAPPTSTGSPRASNGASPSATQSPLPKPQPAADVVVAVFNGTSTALLAAQGQQTLTNAGYTAGQDPADAPQKPVAKTTIYYRTGPNAAQNQSDAQQIATKYFKGAKVMALGAGSDVDAAVKQDVQVAVVLGQDYANKVGG